MSLKGKVITLTGDYEIDANNLVKEYAAQLLIDESNTFKTVKEAKASIAESIAESLLERYVE